MITGVVGAGLEATIHLRAQGLGGQEQEIEAVIDTGFNGSLTLPPRLIAALGLPWLARERVLLGDGRVEQFEVYAATVCTSKAPISAAPPVAFLVYGSSHGRG